MLTRIEHLIKNFDDAEKQMLQLLASEEDATQEELAKMDKALNASFDELLDAELADKNEIIRRIEFLLSFSESCGEHSHLAARVSKLIIQDINVLADQIPDKARLRMEFGEEMGQSNGRPISI